MLKKVAIGAGVLVALFLVVVASRPDTYTVTRTTTIAAAPSVVYPLVSDFGKWEGWSPWAKLDPSMKTTFTGTQGTAGATYAWVGNDQVGSGKMTIDGVKPNEQVDITLQFLKPWESTSRTEFDLKPAGSGTTVSWTMNGNRNFVTKAMFMDMDKMIGGDFEKGLASMKAEAEAEAEAAKIAEAAKRAAEAAAAAAAAPVAAAPPAK